MANFIGMVYGTLKSKGIDTSKMSTEEAIAKFNEISKEDGGSAKGSSERTETTPNKQQVIDAFYEKANFGTDSKNVTIDKVEGTKVHFTFMGQKDVFDTAETKEEVSKKNQSDGGKIDQNKPREDAYVASNNPNSIIKPVAYDVNKVAEAIKDWNGKGIVSLTMPGGKWFEIRPQKDGTFLARSNSGKIYAKNYIGAMNSIIGLIK